jgi:hypothetical protein
MNSPFLALCAAVVLVIVGIVAPASAQDFYLELDRVEADPTSPQFPTVADGSIRNVDVANNAYDATYTWTAPPARIGPEGAQVTLTIQANAPASLIYPGTELVAPGFRVTPDPAQIFVEARNGSNSGSVSVTLIPDGGMISGETTITIGAAYGAHVRYVYRAVSGTMPPVAGGGDGGVSGAGDDQPVLAARIECPRDTIVISELPGLSCQIVISGWRYSSYPVEVLLPGLVDGWGNQANGLQSVINGPYNAQDPTNWTRPEYQWWLDVFACPGQQGAGVNCNGAAAVPGVLTMPIIVRQKDQVDVNLTLTLNAVARGNNGPITPTGISAGGELRFGNVWRIGDFLNVENGPPALGPIRADWLSAIWVVRPTGDGFVRLESRWRPGNFLHVENGVPEVGPIGDAWLSAHWTLEVQEGSTWFRIGNRWRQGEYLNVENGALQLSPVGADWLSAIWWALP